MNYDAILFVSFGGPEGPEDVMPFLEECPPRPECSTGTDVGSGRALPEFWRR